MALDAKQFGALLFRVMRLKPAVSADYSKNHTLNTVENINDISSLLKSQSVQELGGLRKKLLLENPNRETEIDSYLTAPRDTILTSQVSGHGKHCASRPGCSNWEF